MAERARVSMRREGGIAILFLDHPPTNALTLGMVRELSDALAGIQRDADVRAVLLKASGLDFSSGLEWEEWSRLPMREAQAAIDEGQGALWRLEHLAQPSIAAVRGRCAGAGLELVLACDLSIASDDAVFSHPAVDRGWMPSHGGTARLGRRIGLPKTLEFLLTGNEIKAVHALRMGLVDHLAPPSEVLAEATKLATRIAEKPRAAVRAIKRTLIEGAEKPYRNRFLLEAQHAAQLLSSEEYRAQSSERDP